MGLTELKTQGFLVTSLEKLIHWAQSGSLWPMSFGLACCAVEMMHAASSRYDMDRFGMAPRATPRQSDVMIVAGTVTFKMADRIKRLYEQMAEPRWVLSVGACASSGGIFDTYSVLQGIDRIIPVDVYVPGCPPRPEQIIDGIIKIQHLVESESLRRRDSDEYKAMLNTYGIE